MASQNQTDKQYRQFVEREMKQYEPKEVELLVKWTKDSPWESYTVSVPYDKGLSDVMGKMNVYDWKKR